MGTVDCNAVFCNVVGSVIKLNQLGCLHMPLINHIRIPQCFLTGRLTCQSGPLPQSQEE